MVRYASPWDALLTQSSIRMSPRTQETGSEVSHSRGKTAAVLAELERHGSLETVTIGAICELETRHVWGLLKGPRARGQVSFEDGRWSLNRDWRGNEIERAAALLRDAGWTVRPPA
jgi:hypothetical protein